MAFVQIGPDRFRHSETGEVHTCTRDLCNALFVSRDCVATCRVTGRCFEPVFPEHPFERVAKRDITQPRAPSTALPRRSRARNPFRPGSAKQYLRVARGMVGALLFSDTRERLNRRRRQAAGKRGKRPPGGRILPILPRDNAAVEGYAKKIMLCWATMGELPYGRENAAHLHFRTHALGVLYLIQYGLQVDETRLLERDPFLFAMLPPIHDLKEYGFAKRTITVGKNHLKRALVQAPRDTLEGLRDRLASIYGPRVPRVKKEDGAEDT